MDEFKDIKELRALLKSITPKEGEACVYCNALATDKEHVIPKSWLRGFTELKRLGFDVGIPKEVIVPSCRECNLIALDTLFYSIKAKRKYIQEKLKKRYKKLITFKLWSDEEINELSGRLKEQVILFNEVAKAMKKRMQNLDKVGLQDEIKEYIERAINK